MDDYRHLSEDEIWALEENGCIAEDWTNIVVADNFRTNHIRNVAFYGDVSLGVFEKDVRVSNDFYRHSGIRNATLRNVVIGDNCLIENIGNCINNYIVGNECFICDVCTIETTEGATFGEGNNICVLNEAGSGNVILYRGLTSNIAALMLNCSNDKEFVKSLRTLIKEDISRRVSDVGKIGDNVRIINTSEITNTMISDNCEVIGTRLLSDCTLYAPSGDSVYIGAGVICENTIVTSGSAVLNGAKLNNCFVGESCTITNGFTADSSLFFVNCHMANGEACSSFCGPFSQSHHKSSLLIGCNVSFFNAGSATNFSNHAYKMGPIHYGVLERGSKTASGSHILLPAKIGVFSVCLGKIQNHPDTTAFPFSYIIAEREKVVIVPGRNLVSVGLFRDIHKWPYRDVRSEQSKQSHINFDFFNPLTVYEIKKGLDTLKKLRDENPSDIDSYEYKGCHITRKALLKGIQLYDMAMQIFLANIADVIMRTTSATDSCNRWIDLSGLFVLESEIDVLVSKIKTGMIGSITSLSDIMEEYADCYEEHFRSFAYYMLKDYMGTDRPDIITLKSTGKDAVMLWKNMLKFDAEREYAMGDVEKNLLDNILEQIDNDVTYC
ncbi:MAG: DUF4954 family protein [Prevotella sp.]